MIFSATLLFCNSFRAEVFTGDQISKPSGGFTLTKPKVPGGGGGGNTAFTGGSNAGAFLMAQL